MSDETDDPLEELMEQGFPSLAYGLLDKSGCMVYSDPRKDLFGDILNGLLRFYEIEDKREFVNIETDEGELRRVLKGNSYLVVSPGYLKQRLWATLESLNSSKFTLKEAHEETEFGKTKKEEVEQTKVYFSGPLALSNRIKKMGRQGLGLKRILLVGLEAEFCRQEWDQTSNVVTRLAKYARLRPSLVFLVSHPEPKRLWGWLESLGLEPTVVQHLRSHYELESTESANFRTLDNLLEHAEALGVERFCIYSHPPEKAEFILRSSEYRMMQQVQVERPTLLRQLGFYVRTHGVLKTGALECSIHKLGEEGRLEHLTPPVLLDKDDPKYWRDSATFTKCHVDFSNNGLVLEPGVTYAVLVKGANIQQEEPDSGICIGTPSLTRQRQWGRYSKDGKTWWDGGKPFLVAEEQLDFNESPAGEMEVIYVDCHRFVSGVELARVAAFLKPGGYLVQVNFKGSKKLAELIERQFELCPRVDPWYLKHDLDFVLGILRWPHTKKQFEGSVKKSYPYFILAQKVKEEPDSPYIGELEEFWKRANALFEWAKDDEVGLVRRCTSRVKPPSGTICVKDTARQTGEEGGENLSKAVEKEKSPKAKGGEITQQQCVAASKESGEHERSCGTGTKEGGKESEPPRKAAGKKGKVRASGYFQCTEVGELIAKDYRRAKEYIELFTELKSPEVTEEKKMELVERMTQGGLGEDVSPPASAASRAKKGTSFGQQARHALRDRLWVYKICRKYSPNCKIPKFEDVFGVALQEDDEQTKSWQERKKVRFKTALARITDFLYEIITSPLHDKATQVKTIRVVWYRDLAQVIDIPDRSVNHLLNLYFPTGNGQEPRELLRLLLEQLDPLPRGLLQVLQACCLTTQVIGRGRPLLVLVCRIQARGVLTPLESEEQVCKQCGMYERSDRSCAGWYNLLKKGENFLPATVLRVKTRATYGVVTSNTTACEWFVPRERGQFIPLEAFEKVAKLGSEGRIEGWPCHRPACGGWLDREPKVGRVAGCQVCGTRYKGRIDGRAAEHVDYRAEICRLVRHYSSLEPDLPEHTPQTTDFVYVTGGCQGRIEGDRLVITYPSNYTEEFPLTNMYAMVQTDANLAASLEARGIQVRFLGLSQPRHPQVSEALVKVLEKCTWFETFRRKYAWGLIVSYVVATMELLEGPVELQKGAKAVLRAQLRILQQFVKHGKFSPSAFMACEGRLAQEVENLIRETLHKARPGEQLVREGIGRTFGRKGDRLYYQPTHAAAGKTKLDASQNRTSKILRNSLRASNAESEYEDLWMGYKTVELFTHKVHDNPALAGHLDLEEPSQRLLGNRVVFTLLSRDLTAEHFQEYLSPKGFPRCAPTPWGSRALETLVTAFLEEEVLYRGEVQPLAEAHAAHVVHLLECIQKNQPGQYQPFIPIPTQLKDFESLKKLRKLLIEIPKQIGLWYKRVVDMPWLAIGDVLEELSDVLSPLEVGLKRGWVCDKAAHPVVHGSSGKR